MISVSELDTAVQLPGIDRDSYGKPRLPLDPVSLYSFGHLIRCTERLLLDLFTEGLVSGTTHTCLGQELCQMSVVRALDDPDDAVFSNHRNHGHFLTYSGLFHGLVAEIMGRSTGVCHGIGGSQHLTHRHFHSNGVQAGMTGIAVGVGLARQRRASNGIVVCIIGDGTLGQGLMYESLNLASTWSVPVLFVVENNGIAQTTRTADTIAGSIPARGAAFGIETWRCDDADIDLFSRVEEVVAHVRSSRRPGFLVLDTMRLGPHSKGDDLRDDEEMSRIRARDPLRCLGERLSADLRTQLEQRNATFVSQVRSSAMIAPEACLEDLSLGRLREKLVTPQRRSVGVGGGASRPPLNVRSSLNASLEELLTFHPDVVLLGEDLHDPYGGAFKVTAGLSTRFPERVRSTPISEAGIVGAAIGLALAGCRPVVEIMFADFLTLAVDQIYNHAVKFPGMFEHARVPLVIRTPSGGRRGYGPTHSQSPQSLMTAIPGLTVICPSHRHDAGAMLQRAVLEWDSPTVFFEHKLLYAALQQQGQYHHVPDHGDPTEALFPTLQLGEAAADLTVVTYGGMLLVVEEVVRALRREEFVVDIIVPSLLQPIPKLTLVTALAHRRCVAIVEESPFGPGFGSELAASLLEHGFNGRVRRFAPRPIPIPAARSLESSVLLDEGRLFDDLVGFLTSSN